MFKGIENALEQTGKGVLLRIKVLPGSGAFGALDYDERGSGLRIRVKSPPEKGRANLEIEKEFGKIFGKKATIVKGKKSRSKTVLLEKAKESEVLKELQKL